MKVIFAALTLFICMCGTAFAESSLTVIHPKQGVKDDKTGYPIELLRLALEHADYDGNVFLQPSSVEVPQNRVLKLIEQNVVIDVAWYMTDQTREKQLRAIKVPIYKGYFGFRVLLIHPDTQGIFNRELPLQTLKTELIGVQGHDWPDLDILKHNGFNVTSSPSYKGMFDMLNRKRVDYFPRSVLEAWSEETAFPEFNLVVEQNFMLYYPAAVFFFVNKENEQLAKIIESGLQRIINDGTFDLLFEAVQEDFLTRTDIQGRQIIHLNNPFFQHPENPLLAKPSADASQ